MPSWKAQKTRESNAVTAAVSRENRMTNSIRPFAAHETRGAILPVASGEKPMTKNYVRLRRMWDVFAHSLEAWAAQQATPSGGDDQCSCHQLGQSMRYAVQHSILPMPDISQA
jgi:hypothetical protein